MFVLSAISGPNAERCGVLCVCFRNTAQGLQFESVKVNLVFRSTYGSGNSYDEHPGARNTLPMPQHLSLTSSTIAHLNADAAENTRILAASQLAVGHR